MAMKFKNATFINGYLYQAKLDLKKSGENSKNPGTEYIAGSIEIATDEACTNIVPVHFTYVTATTKAGKANETFNVLKNIINKVYKSVMENGKDQATKFRIDSVIGLNEFYSDRNGTEELVSTKRNDGGFVHVVNELDPDEKKRNTFRCDMIITGFRRQEADDENKRPEKGIIKGAIFDFRGSLLPVEFSAIAPAAIDYFESLGVTSKNPVITEVRGRMISETIVTSVSEDSAFGEAEVRETRRTNKDYVITWAAPEVKEFDSEETITAKELNEARAARETYLATIKQRQDEYKASKGNASSAAAPAQGGFNF